MDGLYHTSFFTITVLHVSYNSCESYNNGSSNDNNTKMLNVMYTVRTEAPLARSPLASM